MELQYPELLLKENPQRHAILKNLMQHGIFLYLSFGTDKASKPCIFVEAEKIRRFAYYINNDSKEWLTTYLLHGDIEDFGINSEQSDILYPEQTESRLFLQFLEAGIHMDYNPLIRETTGLIEAVSNCPNGCVRFRLRRTTENLQLLSRFYQPVQLLVG